EARLIGIRARVTPRVGPGQAGSEGALEPAEQAARGAGRVGAAVAAAVEPADALVKLLARADELDRGLRELRDQLLVSRLCLAEPSLRRGRLGARDLAGGERALAEQPGDDVHQPRRDFQRLAGKG